MTRRWASCVLVAILMTLLSGSAFAQARVIRIDRPVPEALKARAEAMVRALRPGDAEALTQLRVASDTVSPTDWVILRVEAKCRSGLCMTVLARASDTEMVPEFVLDAGERVYMADTDTDLWDGRAWPLAFQGAKGSTIAVFYRGERWVFSACAACFPWDEIGDPGAASTELEKPALPPSEPQPPMSFERFRRELGRPE